MSSQPALKLDQAAQLFDMIANRQDMAFGFVRTTCYPKAYMACEMACQQGHVPGKAWGFEDDKPLTGRHPSGGDFKWWFHVAMTLPVETSPGKVEDLIFDPSLFDGPVRFKEWGDKIGAAPHKLGIFPYETSPTELIGNNAAMSAAHSPSMTARAIQKLAEWASMEPAGPRRVFPSETMRSLEPVERLPRVGWETVMEAGFAPRAPQFSHSSSGRPQP